MQDVRVIVGVAGAGKTSNAMEIVEQKLRSGLRWDQIGFSSFSRAACAEAARRASVITGVDPDRLQKDGWFRTIHSCAFRLLGVDSKSILDHDTKAGRDFVAECCGAPRGGEPGTLGAKIDEALSEWDTCRARLSRLHIPTDCTPDQYRSPSDQGCHRDLKTAGTKSPVFSEGCHGVTALSQEHRDSFFEGESANVEQIRCSEGSSFLCIGDEKNLSLKKLKALEGVSDVFFAPQNTPLCTEYKGKTLSQGQGVTPRVLAYFLSDTVTDLLKPEHAIIIRQYEDAKRYSGMLDFTDLLFRYAGFEVDSNLMFKTCWPLGSVPAEVDVFLFDEYQDCSALLDRVAERLSESAGELWMLGDKYQSVYAFSGSDHRVFEAREDTAKNEGKRVLLNRSYRNPESVIEWGEEILREDSEYEERKPYSGKFDGSAGMMEAKDFMSYLPLMATTDTMILARTWFALGKVKERLDELCIPWTSCQEKRGSGWESPVKIAIVLTMQALKDGGTISEQDWRRLTENFPAKYEGKELFRRGEKARWKKMECKHQNVFALHQVQEWGAGEGFEQFVLDEKWRRDQFLLLSVAIEKWGIDVVRNPRIKIGSCHSVKGMQAENVFCLATSSEKASQSGFWEDLFLKYVTITRASKHYRLVVDLVEHAKGKKLFIAAPRGYWEFDKDLPEGFGENDEIGTGHSEPDNQDAESTSENLRGEVPCDSVFDERSCRPAGLLPREIHSDGSEVREGIPNGTPETPTEESDFGWWDFSGGSKL